MLYYFTALLAASVILLFSHPKSEVNRWASIFLVFAAIGGLTDEARTYGYSISANAIQVLNLTVTPYAVAIFCLVYSKLITDRRKIALLKGALLIPVGMTALLTSYVPEMRIDYGWLLAWAAPYYIGGCVLLVVSLFREPDPRNRRNRLITTIIFVPTLLSVLTFIYIAKAVYPDFEFFEYVSYFLIYSFVVGLLCVFVYGVLGFRLKIERDPLDDAMKAVSSGTRMLNHTLKNEIGKISLSSENLSRALSPDDERSRQSLRIIADSADHMLAMVEKIHSRTKDIVLVAESCRLDELVELCVERNRPLFDRLGIVVLMDFQTRPTLSCDPTHVKEAIGNLLANAAEAMKDGGTVRIVLAYLAKRIVLSVEDNGTGISKDALPHLFEPFYSTKKSSRNFGLGLSYVYNVMRKSGGSVSVSSRLGEGTRFELVFRNGIIR
ncbi:sensor histidine kinase [Cohnella terricola]|uniref:histidine kinase n=1 Tax=Cohnella terricola TaxID=1289167 RepID=A0A559JCT4_9BACL|nr:HAMP domain-containing sensor histidine kinase [Cohnella terricola]TVX97692.1 GHKL domain-containing protein [Cohnella terricola]